MSTALSSPVKSPQSPTYSAPSLSQLTWNRISQLEGAIGQIASTKKQLYNNATEVKAKVRNTVSRQMESLRTREVWLLDQVDLLQQTKEEILRKQEDRLQRNLGGLQESLVYFQNDSSMQQGLKRKLSESLENLDDDELIPDQCAELEFEGDVAGLRKAILGFGRVECTYRPSTSSLDVLSPTSDTQSVTSSLPQTFEDYNDVEHHVLYKTVQDCKSQKGNERTISVKVPRLSSSFNQWLLPSVTLAAADFPPKPNSLQPSTSTTTAATSESKAGYPRGTMVQGDWMREKTPPFGIQQWLYDIHNETITEDEAPQHQGDAYDVMESKSEQLTPQDTPAKSDGWLLNFDDKKPHSSSATWLLQSNCDMSASSNTSTVEFTLADGDDEPDSIWLHSSTRQDEMAESELSFEICDMPEKCEGETWLMLNGQDNDDSNTPCPVIGTIGECMESIAATQTSQWLKLTTSLLMTTTATASDITGIDNTMFDLSHDRGCSWILSPSPLCTASTTCELPAAFCTRRSLSSQRSLSVESSMSQDDGTSTPIKPAASNMSADTRDVTAPLVDPSLLRPPLILP